MCLFACKISLVSVNAFWAWKFSFELYKIWFNDTMICFVYYKSLWKIEFLMIWALKCKLKCTYSIGWERHEMLGNCRVLWEQYKQHKNKCMTEASHTHCCRRWDSRLWRSAGTTPSLIQHLWWFPGLWMSEEDKRKINLRKWYVKQFFSTEISLLYI